MLALLLAASMTTALDAERAFAADAQALGQWSAFRKWAADDAILFVPELVKAQEFLKDRPDPPMSVYWWPGRSYVSCDGTLAVNTGPWVRQWGKSVGYFTTVWERQRDGSWKWIYDGGDSLATPRAEGGNITPVTASCNGTPPPGSGDPPRHDRMGRGFSVDGTLAWQWEVSDDGSRRFAAYLFDGDGYRQVIDDRIPAPPK